MRARERWPQWRPQSAAFDGSFAVPTLQQVIDPVRAKQVEHGRPVGLYPETKHPAHFAARCLPLEERLARALHDNGWHTADAPVLLQSFEVASLRRLAGLSPLRRVQLAEERALLDASALREIGSYAQGVGVAKAQVIPRDEQGRLGRPTSLVARAHDAGRFVHAWTFRPENEFLPADLQGRPGEELRRFLATGIDGVFADRPADALATLIAPIALIPN